MHREVILHVKVVCLEEIEAKSLAIMSGVIKGFNFRPMRFYGYCCYTGSETIYAFHLNIPDAVQLESDSF